VLPARFHRIRHYGLLANGSRKASLATARALLQPSACQRDRAQPAACDTEGHFAGKQPTFVCWHCGRPMIIVQTFERAEPIRAPPLAPLT
jgi:hypothetical protein